MPRKQKLSPEEKVKLVRRYLNGEIGVCEAGREYGVAAVTVRRWIAQYETEGVPAFMPRERNRVYSPKVKTKAVRDYLSGMGSVLVNTPAGMVPSDRSNGARRTDKWCGLAA